MAIAQAHLIRCQNCLLFLDFSYYSQNLSRIVCSGVHLRDEQLWSIIVWELLYPLLNKRIWSWVAVVSASPCICASTIDIALDVIFDGLPLRGHLCRFPSPQLTVETCAMPCLVATSPFFLSKGMYDTRWRKYEKQRTALQVLRIWHLSTWPLKTLLYSEHS